MSLLQNVKRSCDQNKRPEHTEGVFRHQGRGDETLTGLNCFSSMSSPKTVVAEDMGRTESSLGERGEEGVLE